MTTADEILRAIADIEAAEGTLSEAMQFYRRLLELQATWPTSSPATAAARDEPPPLPFDAIGERLTALTDLLYDVGLCDAAAVAALRRLAADPRRGDVARAWYEGALAEDSVPGAPPEVVSFVLSEALRPDLQQWAAALSPQLDQEQWRSSRCPICGGLPDFAYVTEDRRRYLVCSRCNATWLFQRVQCPFCGATDPADLSYYTDDTERYRLYICERCRCYLKAIDLTKTGGGGALLPLERVRTVELDEQAQEMGYWPGRVIAMAEESPPPDELDEG